MSASALARIEACPPSHSLPHVYEPPSEAAEGGTVKHLFCVEAATLGREAALANVPPEWRAECAAIDVTTLPHATGGYLFEVAYAYEVANDAAVELGRGVKGRGIYKGVDGATQLVGTADLVGLTDDAVVVLDLKTGRKWLPMPSESLQLLFLALAASRTYRKWRAHIGWIRLIDTTPRLVVETLDPFALEMARERVLAVRARAEKMGWVARTKGAQPDVTVGEHCRYCPALRGCWAHTSMLGGVPEAKTLDAVESLERSAKLARQQLNAQAQQMPVQLGDGRVYGPRLEVRRSIDAGKALPLLLQRHPGLDTTKLAAVTQKALREAGLDVETEMQALAAAGAVTTTEVEKMEAHKP